MDDDSGRLRWGVGQRLEFIEFRLFWEGQINRSDLMRRFAISMPQASADLGRYQELAQKNVRYDSHFKAYVATADFKPVLYQPSARQYLADLRAIADDAVDRERTWLGIVPEFAVVPTPRRRLDPTKLRTVLEAIRTHQSLNIQYQSLTRSEPVHRWISPHALGFDGARWHVRAWCGERREFRDFVLARFLEISDMRLEPIDSDQDFEWKRLVTLRIGPHPRLGEKQRRVIELDFGMTDGALEIEIRQSMSYYLERNLLLDDEAAALPPRRAQLALLNRTELDDIRKKIRDEQQRSIRAMQAQAENESSDPHPLRKE